MACQDKLEVKKLVVDELEARSLCVKSGDGLNRIDIIGTSDGVGIWGEASDGKSYLTLTVNKDGVQLGLFADKTNTTGCDLAVSVQDGHGLVQVIDEEKRVFIISTDDLSRMLRAFIPEQPKKEGQ